jgi:SAM-dependent methyltransferase
MAGGALSQADSDPAFLSGTSNRGGHSYCSTAVNPRKLALLRRALGRGTCLEVGCGNGLYGNEILASVDALVQMDLVDRRADAARSHPFVLMDAMALAVADQAVDYVVAFDVMEHLPDDAAFLEEVRRVCRRRLILSVPNADDTPLGRVGVTHMHHIDKTHMREYWSADLAGVLEAAGFRVVALEPHVNTALTKFGRIFETESMTSRIASKWLYAQTRLFEQVGIFRNTSVPDWFCVADVP